MKKIFFIAFACLIPSANAVDYVKCEAIRAVIASFTIEAIFTLTTFFTVNTISTVYAVFTF